MLNKRVKARIAANKQKRTIPVWKRNMRAFFITQLPPAQAVLSSKHFVVTTLKSSEKAETHEYYSQQADEIFKKLDTWTRHDWNAFIRSDDSDYAAYIVRRNLYYVMMVSRQAAMQLTLESAPFGKGFDARRNPVSLALRSKLVNANQVQQSIGPRGYLTDINSNQSHSDLLGQVPRCQCGTMIGHHNLGVECNSCHTAVKVLSPILNSQSLGRIRRPSGFVTIQGKKYIVSPVVLPADPVQLAKDFEGDILNRNLSLEQRNPAHAVTSETLRVRSIDTDLTGDELVNQYAGWHERRYHKTLTQEEAVAEVQRVGETRANEALRQEIVRNRTRMNGDPWSDLRVVLQPTADRYYERVLHRPLVRDSNGEREMTETEWNQWKQYQDYLKLGAVDWHPGFAPIIPIKKQGE